METRQQRHCLPATGTALMLGLLAGCTPIGGGSAAEAYDEVVIALPSWAGGQATAAVAGHILSEELDVPVRLRSLEQPQAWDELDQDAVQAILEDWGSVPEKETQYVVQHGTVISAGELGPVGRVGWYVPDAFANRHPEVLDWQQLNDHAENFSTGSTGGQGQLLTGHPDDVTRDDALLDALDLDFTTVPSGSEEQLVEELRLADSTGSALLAYLWQPHWLHEELDLSEVELPPHTPGCHVDETRTDCGYPDIPLRKFLSAEFSENGGTAAEFLGDFRWTADEQNEVARLIESDGMTPQGAAEVWVEQNPERVTELLTAED